MAVTGTQNPLVGETTCGSLLHELQKIWDEVGESDEQRDKMLLQLEQECLEVYMRKVDQASKSRAILLQALADANSELSNLLQALGEKTYVGIPEKLTGTIKEQLAAIAPTLEQLWKQKDDRIKEFSGVQSQIKKISGEITGDVQVGTPTVDEDDLSLKKLEELQSQLYELQREKVAWLSLIMLTHEWVQNPCETDTGSACEHQSNGDSCPTPSRGAHSDRLHKVLDFVSTVHDLCAVLGMDFFTTITEVHPSLTDSIGVQSKSISNDTLSNLAKTVSALKEDKMQRLQKFGIKQRSYPKPTTEHSIPSIPYSFRNYENISSLCTSKCGNKVQCVRHNWLYGPHLHDFKDSLTDNAVEN
ncbi:65-kDa microtubule-associated protein 1 [Acorus calamus]|uniref:65-kDa microtubule-associated protein 1 n=1 Tax=Acorus calamus TaxID=4465 RepID=A0AAV9DVM5_ACOCL|nr:65-kDa microtubule-associated protein 1 [Acorus calamus]